MEKSYSILLIGMALDSDLLPHFQHLFPERPGLRNLLRFRFRSVERSYSDNGHLHPTGSAYYRASHQPSTPLIQAPLHESDHYRDLRCDKCIGLIDLRPPDLRVSLRDSQQLRQQL